MPRPCISSGWRRGIRQPSFFNGIGLVAVVVVLLHGRPPTTATITCCCSLEIRDHLPKTCWKTLMRMFGREGAGLILTRVMVY
jgi:hypothetical protein